MLAAVVLGLLALGAALTPLAAAEPPSGPPVNSSLPLVKGTTLDGKKLKAFEGRWNGLKPFSYSVAWQLCDATGGECASIGSASSNTIVASSPDVGHTLRAVVTAKNADGSATATSAPSVKIAPAAPKKKKLPSVAGTAGDGQVLTALNGTWKGTQPLSFTYQWQSCKRGSCTSITGATGQTYGAATAQLGQKLRVLVTATNSIGSATAASKKSAAVVPGPPVEQTPPSISGQPIVEQTLTAEPGSWAGTGPFAYTYQWRSCNLLGECEDISGATGPGYTVGPLQVANSIEVTVTAANSLGSATATSATTSPIGGLLPTNTALPSITGLLQDGGLLSALSGSWSGSEPLSYGYQWLLCDASGASCKEVFGATGTTLGLLTGMIGGTARLVVTATNSAGSTSATSEPTDLIKALLPSNISLPTIAGLLEDGATVSGAKGAWSGSEPSFSYQWLLCNSAGASCKEASGSTGTTLGLSTSEIGSTVRLLVKATNSAGSTSATSEPSSPILAILPANTVIPSLQGVLQTGQLLTAVIGKWSGSEPITYSYQWQTCGLLGKENECKSLAEAIKSTLKLELLQVGLTLRLIVTATNARGAASKASTITNAVTGLLLSPVAGSTAGGTAVKLSAPEVSKATAVSFGSAKASEIEVNSPNEITAVTPPGTEGQVAVTVTTPEGSTHKNSEDMFTYQP